MDNILEIKNLYVKYKTIYNDVLALNGVSLNLKQGESLGLVGETGAGKTTLALTIMGLLPQGSEKRIGETCFGKARISFTRRRKGSEKPAVRK